MKWKKYFIRESSMDDDSASERFILRDVQDIYPDYQEGGLYEDAAWMIDEYINRIFETEMGHYPSRHAKEEAEDEVRDSLLAIVVDFQYWHEEDEEYEEGYEKGRMLFIVNGSDNSIVDTYDCGYGDFPKDIEEQAKDKAIEYAKRLIKGEIKYEERTVKESRKVSLNGLKLAFDRMDNGDGKYGKAGNWEIALGGYDEGYDVSYKGELLIRVNYENGEYEICDENPELLNSETIPQIKRILEIGRNFKNVGEIGDD